MKCKVCGCSIEVGYACGEYFLFSDCGHVPSFFHSDPALIVVDYFRWKNDLFEEMEE